MPGRFGFPAAARSNHDDIDDWLDALGDELAREFPDLIDEPPSHTGNPFGEQGANERGATVREPGPDFTKKRLVPRRVGGMALRGWVRDCEDRLFGRTWMTCMRQPKRTRNWVPSYTEFHDGRES